MLMLARIAGRGYLHEVRVVGLKRVKFKFGNYVGERMGSLGQSRLVNDGRGERERARTPPVAVRRSS